MHPFASLDHGCHAAHNAEHGRPQHHQEHAGEDEQNQRKDDLDGGLCGILFGHLPPLVWGMGPDQQQQHSYGPLTLGTTYGWTIQTIDTNGDYVQTTVSYDL